MKFQFVLPAIVCRLGSGCASNAREAINHVPATTRSTDDQATWVKTVPIMMPMNIMTEKSYAWEVLPESEFNSVLATPLPALSNENKDVPIEEMIGRIFGRKMLWLPRDPQTPDSGEKGETYGQFIKNYRHRTVGDYLRGILSGGTEIGYPWLRTFNRTLFTVRDSPVTDPDKDVELMDIVLVTQKYIVILAVPIK